jgi:hypothetical protein
MEVASVAVQLAQVPYKFMEVAQVTFRESGFSMRFMEVTQQQFLEVTLVTFYGSGDSSSSLGQQKFMEVASVAAHGLESKVFTHINGSGVGSKHFV